MGARGTLRGHAGKAWTRQRLSASCTIGIQGTPYKTVLSCAPRMYDELWVAGECMYKLEPRGLATAGSSYLRPHLHEISQPTPGSSVRWGTTAATILKQWDQVQRTPLGNLAHATHVVTGIAPMTGRPGWKPPRVHVTLATGLSEKDLPGDQSRLSRLAHDRCRVLRQPRGRGRPAGAQGRRALYHLRNKPAWAGEFE